MLSINYNPDVLSCLANLSNDEVFTPPKLVSDILDMLPQELFASKETTFLDPVSKSGVFLREIAKRLMTGLESEIPNQQERINHIFENQLYGIAITELTALLSRRSVYCSKTANGKYSVCDNFETESGNIKFDYTQHTWENGKCIFCNASEEVYSRDEQLETYAYQFIHTNKPEKIFNMKFDVIIGNPPYQLSDGGAGSSAKPIYNKFVEQAKKLNPRFLTMIIPARWYNGGKGLNDFRAEMLNDTRLSQLHDFPNTNDCFPGLNIRGGVCYFLWEKDFNGECTITTHRGEELSAPTKRPLLEEGNDIFIRYNEAISIYRKVRKNGEDTFNKIVSSRKPFGLATNFKSFRKQKSTDSSIFLYRFGDNGYVKKSDLVINSKFSEDWKVFVPYASPGDDSYPHLILSKPIVAGKNTACTETYLLIGPVANQKRANNIAKYMTSSFFRFMVLLAKSTQHITSKTYTFVPIQNFDEEWTDSKLYAKYGINEEEQVFIDSLIRKMDYTYE